MKYDQWIYRIKSLWRYYRRAQSIHHVDSPFLYRLLSKAMDEDRWYYAFEELEVLRKKMKRSDHSIERTDWGAGGTSYRTTIGQVARRSLASAYDCRLLFRMAIEQNPARILELGTSLGLSTLYLSRAAASSRIHTLEGDPVLNGLAKKHFDWMGADNITQHLGTFDNLLPELLEREEPFDFTFTDGHHKREATVRNVSLILEHSTQYSLHIVHDIHHSSQMEQAWNELKDMEAVEASIDLYRMGILVKNRDLLDPVHLTIIPGKWKPWSIGLFR